MNSPHDPTHNNMASADILVDIRPLLELPAEVLNLVLGWLGPHELVQLLQSSRDMAQEVMQHSPGRFAYKVDLHKGVKLAATRQLLQWAPPSTLKLLLSGAQGINKREARWSKLSSLLTGPSSVPDSQRMQQFPCVLELHIQGFSLPSLVPADIVDLCPNVRALHISNCVMHAGSNGGSRELSSSSSSSVWRAERIHTLALEAVVLTAGDTHMSSSSIPSAVKVAEQLRSSLPNVTCLKLYGCLAAEDFLSAFGPGLKELQFPMFQLPSWHIPGGSTHVQQLQKLVMQGATIASSKDMEQLLSLPCLTHLEVESVGEMISEDYSSHPCKWQYLHLHLQGPLRTANRHVGLSLDALAKLPLHALTSPLRLGSEAGGCMQIGLPRTTEDGMLRMKRLAKQLKKCGVQLLAARIAWVADEDSGHDDSSSDDPGDTDDSDDLDSMDTLDGEPDGPTLALRVIAPALGLHAHVELIDMTVDQPVMEALAMVYGSSMKELSFDRCTYKEDMKPIWQAALSGLPALNSLKVSYAACEYDNADDIEQEATWTKLAFDLAAAMAQQPAGRCIHFVLAFKDASDQPFEDSDHYVACVLEDAEDELAGVEVLAQEVVLDDSDPCDAGVGLCITSS